MKYLTIIDYSVSGIYIYTLEEIGLSMECQSEDIEEWIELESEHSGSQCHYMLTETISINIK
jgi:hypothetical protein